MKFFLTAILFFGAAMFVAAIITMTAPRARVPINSDQKRLPVVVIEGLNLFRYSQSKIDSKVSAQIATFISPDVLELRGDVEMESMTDETTSRLVQAGSVRALFKADGLLNIKSENQLTELLLNEGVVLREHDTAIETANCRYTHADGILSSVDPVRVVGKNREFTGSSGFVYKMKTQDLEVMGSVDGEFTFEPDRKRN